MAGYYDLVLGLVPLGLGVVAGALTLLGYEPTVAIPAGSVFAIALIGHAMFVRAPTDAAPEGESARGHAPTGD